jgi:regulator of protease activity HflC (stomatin/prohibitin superfamily)
MGCLLGFAILIIVFLAFSGMRVVQPYERGVIFILGRLVGAKGPGTFWVPPFISHMIKIDLRIVTRTVPGQEVVTRDNVTIKVTGVLNFYVIDPSAAVVNVINYTHATMQVGRTVLRDVLSQLELDELLAQRIRINSELQTTIDDHTKRWGVKVTSVEYTLSRLPRDLKSKVLRTDRSGPATPD